MTDRDPTTTQEDPGAALREHVSAQVRLLSDEAYHALAVALEMGTYPHKEHAYWAHAMRYGWLAGPSDLRLPNTTITDCLPDAVAARRAEEANDD